MGRSEIGVPHLRAGMTLLLLSLVFGCSGLRAPRFRPISATSGPIAVGVAMGEKDAFPAVHYVVSVTLRDESGNAIVGRAIQVHLDDPAKERTLATVDSTSDASGRLSATLVERLWTGGGKQGVHLTRRIRLILGGATESQEAAFSKGLAVEVSQPSEIRYRLELQDETLTVNGERVDAGPSFNAVAQRDELDLAETPRPLAETDLAIITIGTRSVRSERNERSAAEEVDRVKREKERVAAADRDAAEARAKAEQQKAERKEWEAAGFKFGDGRVCGYSSRDCAPRWQALGFALQEAQGWMKARFEPEVAVVWRQAGLTSEDATGWGSFTPDAMRAWKEAGFDATAAHSLQGARLDPDAAKAWREAGFDADTTVSWRRRGFTVQAALKVKETCPKGIEPLSNLVQSNPFDVEGRCFEFAAQTLQIIDRTHALYILSPELDPYYVEFTTRSAPPMGFQGFVVGVGTFSYVATSGVDKVVAHLQQINLGR